MILTFLNICDAFILCSDINECTENIDGCNQLCMNTMGSYLCNCTIGYRLASDQRICQGKRE